MYLKKIEVENTGPIELLIKNLPFHENGNPKPIVIIGQNGAGKSIVLSHIVNALLSGKQSVYEDSEVETGKVFKYRSPNYIKSGKSFSYSKVSFDGDFFVSEWQLDRTKSNFESSLKWTPNNMEWEKINHSQTSFFDSNFGNDNPQLKDKIDTNCVLYFPPNRFEEPGWLNYDNLINKADYRFLKRLSNFSNRLIINYAPLKENQNWLLDVIFDKFSFELKTVDARLPINTQGGAQQLFPITIFQGYEGESNIIYNEVIKFLKLLFQTNNSLRFGVGKRRDRKISILKDDSPWIPNIFNLSTGETIILNIFLTIIRDYDLANVEFQNLAEIKGIVVIDEIDIHLHSNLQYTVLPQLIRLFPKVQFILTSHSPLFLLGLKNELGAENFEIINLPQGINIDVESFSEFENAYNYFRESVKFKEDVKNEIIHFQGDLLFLEGDYDIRYIEKAAELLKKEDVLSNFKMVDSVGYGNIDKVFKHFDSKLSEITPQKLLLLYDCDTNKSDTNKGQLFKRVIPTVKENPINKGIENLLKRNTIEKAIEHKNAFIDVTPEIIKTVRGKKVTIPENWEVNKDEKRNLCDWVVENGTVEDFQHFNSVFDILEKIKNAI